MKRIVLVAVLISILLTGCIVEVQPEPTAIARQAQKRVSPTEKPKVIPTNTAIPEPTARPKPTEVVYYGELVREVLNSQGYQFGPFVLDGGVWMAIDESNWPVIMFAIYGKKNYDAVGALWQFNVGAERAGELAALFLYDVGMSWDCIEKMANWVGDNADTIDATEFLCDGFSWYVEVEGSVGMLYVSEE